MFSDDEDLLRIDDPMELEMGFANVVVVDNLPVVPPEKFEKLENVIRKIYSQIGAIKEGGLWMPVNPETKKTYGYCFIEYNTPQVLCHMSDAFFPLEHDTWLDSCLCKSSLRSVPFEHGSHMSTCLENAMGPII